jgi:hypothetical protein
LLQWWEEKGPLPRAPLPARELLRAQGHRVHQCRLNSQEEDLEWGMGGIRALQDLDKCLELQVLQLKDRLLPPLLLDPLLELPERLKLWRNVLQN